MQRSETCSEYSDVTPRENSQGMVIGRGPAVIADARRAVAGDYILLYTATSAASNDTNPCLLQAVGVCCGRSCVADKIAFLARASDFAWAAALLRCPPFNSRSVVPIASFQSCNATRSLSSALPCFRFVSSELLEFISANKAYVYVA